MEEDEYNAIVTYIQDRRWVQWYCYIYTRQKMSTMILLHVYKTEDEYNDIVTYIQDRRWVQWYCYIYTRQKMSTMILLHIYKTKNTHRMQMKESKEKL